MFGDNLSIRVEKLEKRVAELEAMLKVSPSPLPTETKHVVSASDILDMNSKFSIRVSGKKNKYFLQAGISTFDTFREIVVSQIEKLLTFPADAAIYVGYASGARYNYLDQKEIEKFFDNQKRVLVLIQNGLAHSSSYIRVKTRNFMMSDPNDLQKVDACIDLCENCSKNKPQEYIQKQTKSFARLFALRYI